MAIDTQIRCCSRINLLILLIIGFTAEASAQCVIPEPLLWLRADSGWSAGTWTDQTTNNRDGANVGDPTLIANGLNFNPTVEYDGNDETISSTPELIWLTGNHHLTVFAVYTPGNTSTAMGVFGNQGNGGSNNTMLWNGIIGDGAGGAPDYPAPSLYGMENQMLSWELDEENNVNGVANSTQVFDKGVNILNYTYNENNNSQIIPNMHVGKSGTNPVSQFFTGSVSEFIIYESSNGSVSLTDGERERVQSYLGLKYGFTLPHDYFSSDGNTYWDLTTNSGYTNRITIIGRDDCYPLDQRKSISTESGGIVAVAHTATGGTVATPDAFPNDLDFFGFGDDDGALTLSQDMGSYVNTKVTRNWKVEETGTIGNVTISINKADFPATITHMIIFSDPLDPISGTQYAALTDAGSSWEAEFDFTSGQFFSFVDLDNDRDGIDDVTDLDDDNDGIPDDDEIYCGADSWHVGWFHSTDGSPTISVTTLVAGATNEVYGAGLSAVVSGTLLQLSNIDAADFTEAKSLDEYIEVSITTNVTLTTPFLLTGIVQYLTAPGNNNGHRIAVEISDDGFLTSNVVISDVLTVDRSTYQSYDVSDRLIGLVANTTYTVRVYFYAIPPANSGQASFDDFNLRICDDNQLDFDGDGVWNHIDLDSDNDGVYDLIEASHSAPDTDLDGIIDGAAALFGANGLFNALETAPDNGILNYTVSDSDSNGSIDAQQLDSDADGCNDVLEAGYADVNNDGELGPVPLTVDGNGLVTSGGP